MSKFIPTDSQIKHVRSLMDNKAYEAGLFALSRICFENCPCDTKADREYRSMFKMFMGVFGAMEVAHSAIGHLTFSEFRWSAERELCRTIENCFGLDTWNTIDDTIFNRVICEE